MIKSQQRMIVRNAQESLVLVAECEKNDSLQLNQLRWMKAFATTSATAAVEPDTNTPQVPIWIIEGSLWYLYQVILYDPTGGFEVSMKSK